MKYMHGDDVTPQVPSNGKFQSLQSSLQIDLSHEQHQNLQPLQPAKYIPFRFCDLVIPAKSDQNIL
jgi:hypothetical protein